MHLTQHKANYINVGNCQKSSSVSTKPTNMLHNLAVYCVDDGRKKRRQMKHKRNWLAD